LQAGIQTSTNILKGIWQYLRKLYMYFDQQSFSKIYPEHIPQQSEKNISTGLSIPAWLPIVKV
jgi:hypothetical protein